MPATWSDYQEEVATFFRSLGMTASTNVRNFGVRTTHDVDVLVQSQRVGFDITWIVECKLWKSRVTKAEVLAFRAIVNELGVDRGILLAEGGFQSGASEAATLTNVHLTSLANLRTQAHHDIFRMRICELYDRAMACKQLYWDTPKNMRIEFGLRPESGGYGYSGAIVISLAENVLLNSLRGTFPIEVDYMSRSPFRSFPESLISAEETILHLEPLISELENKLRLCSKS